MHRNPWLLCPSNLSQAQETANYSGLFRPSKRHVLFLPSPMLQEVKWPATSWDSDSDIKKCLIWGVNSHELGWRVALGLRSVSASSPWQYCLRTPALFRSQLQSSLSKSLVSRKSRVPELDTWGEVAHRGAGGTHSGQADLGEACWWSPASVSLASV